MHNAPAVNFPVGRLYIHGLLIALTLLITLLSYVNWWWQTGRWSWPEWGAMLAALTLGAIAWGAWGRAPAGQLNWDGAQWWWHLTGYEICGQVSVELDWQCLMLLALRPQGGPVRWFWVARSQAPESWEPLRRAVYAGQAAEGARAGERV